LDVVSELAVRNRGNNGFPAAYKGTAQVQHVKTKTFSGLECTEKATRRARRDEQYKDPAWLKGSVAKLVPNRALP